MDADKYLSDIDVIFYNDENILQRSKMDSADEEIGHWVARKNVGCLS